MTLTDQLALACLDAITDWHWGSWDVSAARNRDIVPIDRVVRIFVTLLVNELARQQLFDRDFATADGPAAIRAIADAVQSDVMAFCRRAPQQAIQTRPHNHWRFVVAAAVKLFQARQRPTLPDTLP